LNAGLKKLLLIIEAWCVLEERAYAWEQVQRKLEPNTGACGTASEREGAEEEWESDSVEGGE